MRGSLMIILYNVVVTFSLKMKSLKVTIQIKAI